MNPATNSQQALQNLQSFQSGIQKPEDILTGQEQQLGVPQAQAQVQGLRGAIQNTTNLLNNVAPSVYGRTQNSLETDAQANRNIQNEQAPLSATLDKQNTDYGNQESDLQTLLGRAQSLSTLKAQGQDSQLGYLQNIYQDLFGSEKDAADRAEQAREADLSARASSGGGGISLGGLGLDTGGSTAGGSATMTQRNGGGFNFVDGSGKSISAAQFSAIKGVPFRTLLQEMASAGDSGAKAALGFVGNDYGYDPSKITTTAMANLYNSLVGGTGKTAQALPAGLSYGNSGSGLTY